MLPEPGLLMTQFARCGRCFGLAVSLLALSACATLPTPSGVLATQRETRQTFALEARFSLRNNNQNYSGRLSWQHDGANNTLLLASPLGQGIAEIVTDSAGARLTTSEGKVYAADDTETLTQQALGYALPLARLTDWVRGGGVDGDVMRRDAQGRVLARRNVEWSVEYGYESDDPEALPVRLVVGHAGGLELRLHIDEWSAALPAGKE